MSYMQTFGPAANPITSLGWGLTIVSCAVVLIIGALVLAASWRRQARPTDAETRQLVLDRGPAGLIWISIGVGSSTVVLFGLIIWTLITLEAVASPAEDPAVTIEVRAHQWWWEARYLGKSPERTFTTANELHIPVGSPVRLLLIADDVIHSFWIPALAGKTDVIPGQTNMAWLQADRPGVYRGQCTEYCGEQHAQMAAFVIAEPREAFESWWKEQLDAAPAPAADAPARGQSVFMARCAACHTIRGTTAGGILGPDLTHLMSRRTIAAGILPNNLGNLSGWIADAQGIKPGSRMPTLALSGPELTAVNAYLQTLR
jgi:cytochrome c oxidase subunit 2